MLNCLNLKRCCLALLTCLVIASSARPQAAEKKLRPSQWRLFSGVSVNPSFNYSLITRQGASAETEAKYRALEIPFINLVGSVDIGIRYREKWEFTTGMRFTQGGYNEKEQEVYSIVPDPAGPASIRYTTRWNYVEVPIQARWYASRWFFMESGPGVQFYTNSVATTHIIYGDGHPEKNRAVYRGTHMRAVVPCINAGAGIRLFEGRSWKYTLQWRSSAGLIQVAHDVDLNRRMIAHGLQVSAHCYF